MAATRRLQKELGEIRNSSSKSFRDVQVDESNLLVWQGLLVPEKAPYNKVKCDGFEIPIHFKMIMNIYCYPGCIHNRHSVPRGVSIQASESLV